ncbi:MAG: ferritin [bacterium]
MIGAKMQEALCEQIKHELESAYLYLAMAAHFHSQGLDGMAHWMRVQAQEEIAHAMKFFDHIQERGGRIELLALAKPKKEWPSALVAFQEAYQHEQFITSKIHALIELATKEIDHAMGPVLHWFVDEQIEEEASTSQIAQMLERIGSSGSGLVMLDHELGSRKGED